MAENRHSAPPKNVQSRAKNQRRFDGFDTKIISMYARGQTTREIQAHLAEIYAVEVSPDFISTVTDSVLEEVREWQAPPLDGVYPILFFDALPAMRMSLTPRCCNSFITASQNFAPSLCAAHSPRFSFRPWRLTSKAI